MNIFVSAPIEVPPHDEITDMKSADLVFYGIDHSGPSYEARVFLNNPNADIDTPRTAENGYVGSFSVFGHDRCFGDEGHCDTTARETDAFDFRPQHPITPITKTVIVDADHLDDLRGSEVVITAVAVDVTGTEAQPSDALDFEMVRLLTYSV